MWFVSQLTVVVTSYEKILFYFLTLDGLGTPRQILALMAPRRHAIDSVLNPELEVYLSHPRTPSAPSKKINDLASGPSVRRSFPSRFFVWLVFDPQHVTIRTTPQLDHLGTFDASKSIFISLSYHSPSENMCNFDMVFSWPRKLVGIDSFCKRFSARDLAAVRASITT